MRSKFLEQSERLKLTKMEGERLPPSGCHVVQRPSSRVVRDSESIKDRQDKEKKSEERRREGMGLGLNVFAFRGCSSKLG